MRVFAFSSIAQAHWKEIKERYENSNAPLLFDMHKILFASNQLKKLFQF